MIPSNPSYQLKKQDPGYSIIQEFLEGRKRQSHLLEKTVIVKIDISTIFGK